MGDKELQAIIDSLREQRTAALDAVAQLNGQVAALTERLHDKQTQLEAALADGDIKQSTPMHPMQEELLGQQVLSLPEVP